MPPSKAVIGQGLPNLEYSATFDMRSRVRKILTEGAYPEVSDDEIVKAISKWKQMRLEAGDDTELELKEIARQIVNLVLKLYEVRKILTKNGYFEVTDDEIVVAISKWDEERLKKPDGKKMTFRQMAQQIANLILELYKAAAAFNSSDDENSTAMSTGKRKLQSFDVISRRNESNLYFV